MVNTSHISLSELQTRVVRALDGVFPVPVWVVAEVAELKVNGAGHCYFELVEKGAGKAATVKAAARAVAWRGTWASLSAYFRGITGDDLASGMKVLLKVVVTYHELYGFSLVINDIDPSYTLGDREQQRLATIARLKADGVWDMNRELGFPYLVQRIAVVSSSSAAGFRDFVQELSRFPFRFEVTLFEAVMQGSSSETSIVSVLETIAERADDFDIVVIIRGGGSASDLSAFDSYRLASHIAQFPLPVATGIGHDKDRSIADMVAALELKTPTAVAVWLGEGLETEWLQLESLARVVAAEAVELTRTLELRLQRLSGEIARRTGEVFLKEGHRLALFERTVSLRRPENILALGYAIVRADGKAVLDAAKIVKGQPLDITLHKGTLKVTAK